MTKRRRGTVGQAAVVCLLFAGLLQSPSAGAAESILRFHSLVQVRTDGSLDVTETITVRAEGRSIKRGIYRTFPTSYRGGWGQRVRIPFKVQEVLRDGRTEPWHSERITNGVKVYFGRKSVLLDHGEYTYTFRYRTDRQLGFFDDFDELYWNVTGHDWDFPIEKAEAEIRLPAGAGALRLTAYTGKEGDRGMDWTSAGKGEEIVRFTTSRNLRPGEGLTVAVSWPKGFVREPDAEERRKTALADNAAAVAAFAGLAALVFYYLIAWITVGKDPPRGVVMTLYEPPEEYSPAAMSFLMNMGYDDRAFAATVVDMAVKGYLTIEEDEGVFTLRRTGAGEEGLFPGQRGVARTIFGTYSSIVLQRGNHKRIRKAVDALKKSLRRDFGMQHFKTNRKYLIPGAVLTLLTLAAIAVFSGASPESIFLTAWISFWTVGCWALFSAVRRAWQDVRAGGGLLVVARAFGAVFITLFAMPFFGAEIGAFVMLARAVSYPAAGGLLAALLVSLIFSHLLKAPTIFGRKALDRIEGFRRYLEAAEKDRLERMKAPEMTPGLFEKYLPYALALDVENSWSEKFSDVLSRTGEEGAYRPGWYSGSDSWRGLETTRLASSLGASLTAAVSSSSTPPGSSSGSGGGGSSGGGGGGGGGGGW